jgi:hypothetical protein
MPNVGKEMAPPLANVCLDFKGILTLNASQNAQSILSARIIGHVFKTNAKTPARVFVEEMLSALFRTIIQTVGVIPGTLEIHSEHAI